MLYGLNQSKRPAHIVDDLKLPFCWAGFNPLIKDTLSIWDMSPDFGLLVFIAPHSLEWDDGHKCDGSRQHSVNITWCDTDKVPGSIQYGIRRHCLQETDKNQREIYSYSTVKDDREWFPTRLCNLNLLYILVASLQVFYFFFLFSITACVRRVVPEILCGSS